MRSKLYFKIKPKSEVMLLVNYIVKEQRLGGSLQEKSSTPLAGGCLVYCLRRTLKGFEINYQIIVYRPGIY